MLRKNESRFCIDDFNSPDNQYAPIYAWVWNSVCTKEIIDAQLSEMQRLGIRAFYIIPEPKGFRPESMPTELTPDYLTPEYLELYSYALRSGKERGMLCWMYDEGGWPSGGACGRVLRDHPEYAKRVLCADERTFKKGSEYHPSSCNVLAAFIDCTRIIENGYVFDRDSSVTEFKMLFQNGGGSDYPDLLNKDSTEYFINVTHDKYASVLGDILGNDVKAIFTDEPKAPRNPFNSELAEEYERIYGESVLPYLPLLMGLMEVNEDNIHVLYRWYDICSRKFCENFMLPCKRWANSHGMSFTGHLDKDHDHLGCVKGGENFHIMRALRCMDIPGIDVIWRQIYPTDSDNIGDEKNCCNGFFPRYASSAARQIGTEFAMTESFGVLGPGITYDDMRFILGYQAIRGVNIFNFMTISLGRSGQHLAQELPSFTEDQIYFRDLPRFNKYLERLAYVSSLGERACDTALYYPIQDFWGRKNSEMVSSEFDALGRTLEDKLVDFDIIDDDIICNAAEMKDGSFTVGKAVYKHIIIPKHANLPRRTLDAIERLEAAGVTVSHTTESAVPSVSIEGNANGLRAARRIIVGGELICLFRERGDIDTYRINVPSQSVCTVSLETGDVCRASVLNGVFEISLAIGETAVLMLTDDTYPMTNADKHDLCKIEINTPFRLKKDRSLTCTDSGFTNIVHIDAGVMTDLGDWSSVVGTDYSGSCVYETEFDLCEKLVGKSGEIDLGDVCYSARVELNGQVLGVTLTKPHRLSIPRELLKEKNKLSITVTNTTANWYCSTDYFDRWKESELSPYFYEDELKYAADYVKGGLYGPIKIKLEQ